MSGLGPVQTAGITIFAAGMAFAALKVSGKVVTWGNPSKGGDSRSVATELQKGVQAIYSTGSAFAAVLEDGKVVNVAGEQSPSLHVHLSQSETTHIS